MVKKIAKEKKGSKLVTEYNKILSRPFEYIKLDKKLIDLLEFLGIDYDGNRKYI